MLRASFLVGILGRQHRTTASSIACLFRRVSASARHHVLLDSLLQHIPSNHATRSNADAAAFATEVSQVLTSPANMEVITRRAKSDGQSKATAELATAMRVIEDARVLGAIVFAVEEILPAVKIPSRSIHRGPPTDQAVAPSPSGQNVVAASVILSAIIARAAELGQFAAAASAWSALRAGNLRPDMAAGIDFWIVRLIEAHKSSEALVIINRALELNAVATARTLWVAVEACSVQVSASE
jgi:hypothetical protein